MARTKTATMQEPLDRALSLKDLIDSQGTKSLEFTGETTAKGNPLFTSGTQTYPIALPLLKYYFKQRLVEMDDDDNIVCEDGWRVKNDTWQPKSRVETEL